MAKKESKPIPAPTGRPSKYDPKYCEMLIEHMSSGLSYESFAAIVDTHKDTLYEWEKVHPAFSDAKKRAFSKNLIYWEKLGQSGMWGNKDNIFNSTVWIFNMKNRHRWRDRQEVEIRETEENQLQQQFKNMTVEQLLKMARESQDEI